VRLLVRVGRRVGGTLLLLLLLLARVLQHDDEAEAAGAAAVAADEEQQQQQQEEHCHPDEQDQPRQPEDGRREVGAVALFARGAG